MLTGRSPSSLGASFHNTVLPDDATTLAQYLQAAGYYTAGFVAAGFVSAGRGFARGFHVFDDAASRHPTSQQNVAAELNGYVTDWLDAWTPDSQPRFLFLYYIDPHTWYHPPPPYDTLYDSDYTGPFTPDVYRDGEDVVAGVRVPDERDVEHVKALYDGETAYWDAQLGLLLSALDDRHLLDNTILILTSDHGQAFGEHGKWIHANSLYEEVLRVPLIMCYPGVISPGRVVEAPVQNMDLLPTVLDWVGIPIPPGLQAVSLRPLAEGLTNTLPRDIFSEMAGVTDPSHWAHWIAPRSDLRSVQRGPWKFIHHVGNPDADELYRLNPSSVYETENLILSEPELARELRTAILEWFSLYQANLPYIAK
jgi:arylsulfatase